MQELMQAYLTNACKVCWLMVLQNTELSLWPTQFEPNEPVMFDEKNYHMNHGSDTNVSRIWYHVWPSIKREGVLLEVLQHVVTGLPPP